MADKNDAVAKIFGKTTQELFYSSNEPEYSWKTLTSKDDSEFLSRTYRFENLAQSQTASNKITEVIIKYEQDDDSHLSISRDGVTVILHGHEKGPVPEGTHELARAIDAAIAVVPLVK